MSDSLRPHRLQPARLLCPWDFLGNSTGVDCHCLLQGIFPTQGSNPGLLHCRQRVYHLSHLLLSCLLQFRDISQGMSITLLPQHLCICLCISAFASACKALLPAPLQDWIHVTFRSPLCVTSGWPSRAPPLPQTALHRITLFIFFIVLDTFGYSVIYICMCCLSLLSEMQPP